MPSIWVSSLADAPDVALRIGASHMLTVLRGPEQAVTPPSIAVGNHLKIDINDINVPQEGLIHPDESHLGEIIAFARAWPRERPILIHCFAGISRSTASALITATIVAPHLGPRELAQRLRRVSPTATPNALMIGLADTLLGHGGSLVAAVNEIGVGEMATTAVPFELPL